MLDYLSTPPGWLVTSYHLWPNNWDSIQDWISLFGFFFPCVNYRPGFLAGNLPSSEDGWPPIRSSTSTVSHLYISTPFHKKQTTTTGLPSKLSWSSMSTLVVFSRCRLGISGTSEKKEIDRASAGTKMKRTFFISISFSLYLSWIFLVFFHFFFSFCYWQVDGGMIWHWDGEEKRTIVREEKKRNKRIRE